jgi:acyl-CoA thioesterase-1
MNKQHIWFVVFFVVMVVSGFWTPVERRLYKVETACIDQAALTRYGPYLIDTSWAGQMRKRDVRLWFYHDADLALPPYAPGRVVFFGDSIIETWSRIYPAAFFPGKPYVGRGVHEQVTSRMIWRFHQDVIALHPEAVVILAGTNDLMSLNTPQKDIETNMQHMVRVAQRHGIRVVLCSIPPVDSAVTHIDQALSNQASTELNAWLRQYAAQQHLPFADFHSVLANPDNSGKPQLTRDGVHPNLAGYQAMAPLAQQALDTLPQR